MGHRPENSVVIVLGSLVVIQTNERMVKTNENDVSTNFNCFITVPRCCQEINGLRFNFLGKLNY